MRRLLQTVEVMWLMVSDMVNVKEIRNKNGFCIKIGHNEPIVSGYKASRKCFCG